MTNQAYRWGRGDRPDSLNVCCLRHRGTLTEKTFEIIKYLLIFSLEKPKQKVGRIFETYKLLVDENIYYMSNLFCKNVLKIATA